MNFLAKIKKSPETESYEVLSARETSLLSQRVSVEAKIKELMQNRGAAIVNGISIGEVSKDVSSAKEELASIQAGLDEVGRRLRPLKIAHHNGHQQPLWGGLQGKASEIVDGLMNVARLLKEYAALENELGKHRSYLQSVGRQDLCVSDPWMMLRRAYETDPDFGAAPVRPGGAQTIAQISPLPLPRHLSCQPFFGPPETLSPHAPIILQYLDRIRTLKLPRSNLNAEAVKDLGSVIP